MTMFANFSFVNYAVHLLAGVVLLIAFFVVYTRVTIYNEVALIMQGNNAAALSLGGALIGFTLTVASAILHSAGLVEFGDVGTAGEEFTLEHQQAINGLMRRGRGDRGPAQALGR
mgnify:CR=1 FL=1